MKKLIIDRSKWYRGNGASGSRLLRQDGMRCCLGFDMQQIGGVPVPLLIGSEYPYDVLLKNEPEAQPGDNCAAGLVMWEVGSDRLGNTAITVLMARVNDYRIGDPAESLIVSPSLLYELFPSGLSIKSEADREAILTIAFRSIGRDVEFVDGAAAELDRQEGKG